MSTDRVYIVEVREKGELVRLEAFTSEEEALSSLSVLAGKTTIAAYVPEKE